MIKWNKKGLSLGIELNIGDVGTYLVNDPEIPFDFAMTFKEVGTTRRRTHKTKKAKQ